MFTHIINIIYISEEIGSYPNNYNFLPFYNL